MSSGRPDYFGRTSNVTAVLGADQEPWTVSESAEINGNSWSSVYSYTVPEGAKINITYFGIGCYYPGIQMFYMKVDGVTILKGWFDIQRDMIVGGNTGYMVKAGSEIEVIIENHYDKQNLFSIMIVGFVQYI